MAAVVGCLGIVPMAAVMADEDVHCGPIGGNGMDSAALLRTREDFSRMLDDARQWENTLNRQAEELAAEEEFLRSFRGDYLVRTVDSWVGLGERDVEQLASAVALMVLLADTEDISRVPLLPGDTPLHDAINGALIESGMREQARRRHEDGGFDLAGYSQIARATIQEVLADLTRDNRREIDARLREVTRQRAAIAENRKGLARLVETATVCRQRTLSEDVTAGFLNREGFYGMRRSGDGWRKMNGGAAYRISGHDGFILKVVEGTFEPYWNHNHWVLPVGIDFDAFFAERSAAKRAQSVQACKQVAASCPCGSPPDIWTGGPDYVLLAGPFEKIGDARATVGQPIGNLQPGSSSQWHYDKDRKYEEAQAACAALR